MVKKKTQKATEEMYLLRALGRVFQSNLFLDEYIRRKEERAISNNLSIKIMVILKNESKRGSNMAEKPKDYIVKET